MLFHFAGEAVLRYLLVQARPFASLLLHAPSFAQSFDVTRCHTYANTPIFILQEASPPLGSRSQVEPEKSCRTTRCTVLMSFFASVKARPEVAKMLENGWKWPARTPAPLRRSCADLFLGLILRSCIKL